MSEILTSYSNLQDLKKALTEANINPVSFLATDFLNHYNEFIMQLDMIPEFPEVYEDCLDWKPKTYKQHFEQSTFKNKEMAIEAYDIAPDVYRSQLEQVIKKLDGLILFLIGHIKKCAAIKDMVEIVRISGVVSPDIKELIDRASAIINGDRQTLRQREIDKQFK